MRLTRLGAVAVAALVATVTMSAPTEVPDETAAAPTPAPAPAVTVSPSPTTSPSVAAVPVSPAPAPASLPVATVDSLIPAPAFTGTLDDVVGAATPLADRTVAYAAPGGPALMTLDRTVLGDPRVWLAVGQQGGWVRVLVPLGRGALPSVDPAAVNGRAVWVPASAVVVAPVASRVMVDVSDRTAAITSVRGETTTVSVGVGVPGVSDTPTGLTYVVGFTLDQHARTVALLAMQSTRLDGYDGASFAATAMHVDPEHGAAVGQARSNGCIRMLDGDFENLVRKLPPGTPVLIQP